MPDNGSGGASPLPFAFSRPSPGSTPQVLAGRWEGSVAITTGITNRLVVKIAPAPCSDVIATVENQDPSFPDLIVTRLQVSADSLHFEIADLNLRYRGAVAHDRARVVGVLQQNDVDYPVTFVKAGPS